MNLDSQQKQKKSCSDYKHLETLSEKIRENIEFVLEKLDISDYNIEHDQVTMPCPVHGGDNKQACCIFIGKRAYVVNWKCFTHHCQKEYNSGIFGFIQGRLSFLNKKKISKSDSIKWIEKTFGIFSEGYDSSYSDIIKQNQINCCSETKDFVMIPKNLITNRLVKEVPYYLNRGFSQEFLDSFNIGICIDKTKKFYNRIVVPVYDIDYNNYVGATARTTYDKCPVCKFYHPQDVLCPKTRLDQFKYSKWINSPGFKTELFFYNSWFAKDSIIKTQTAILVEGQEDVWRIYNSGINNVLGCFGSDISDAQKKTLEDLGVLNIIMFPDPDNAGLNFYNKTVESLGEFYNIEFVKSNKDPADHSNTEIRNLIDPIIRKF